MAGETDFVEKEKSLFLTQIWHLEEQLESCQFTLKELETQHKDLLSQYSALEKEKKEKTERLKQLIGIREKNVEDLSEELEEQKQKAKQDREFLQQQHQQHKQKLLEMIDNYQLKHTTLAAALAEKEKQMIILKQQVSGLEAAEKQLVNLEEEQEAEVNSLKMKMESDKKKFDEMMELFEPDKSLMFPEKESTKETIQFLQNVKSHQVEKQSALSNRQTDLDSSKQDLTQKTDTLIKQKTTLENVNELQEVNQLRQTFRQLTVERAEHLSNLSGAQKEAETLRRCRTRKFLEYHQGAKIGQLEAELQKETIRKRQLEKMKQKAADFVKHILLDPDEPSESQQKTRRLVDILKNSERTRLTFNNSTEQSRQGQKLNL